MTQHLSFSSILAVLAGLLPAVQTQTPVPISFQTAPVLVRSGSQAVLTVVTTAQVLSISWNYPGGGPIGIWVGGAAFLNQIPQYNGRVNITATQLKISPVQLSDAGSYTVVVNPIATTGLSQNSQSVQLKVYDAVQGVTLFVPSVALEGGNITLTCTWTKGTDTTVIWGEAGVALTSNSRITIIGGPGDQSVLVINPASRNDAGTYSCTVSNPVSAGTATSPLTIYYGPDPPTVTQQGQASCVGGGQVTLGQTLMLTCTSNSLPPAQLSWQVNNQPISSTSSGSGTLSLPIFSTNQSGQYMCVASNAITTVTTQSGITISVVTTCLSVGAVAGIVVGCFVAIILIIIAIILLVRWRNVDRRLRDVSGAAKANRKNPPAPPVVSDHPHRTAQNSVRDQHSTPSLSHPHLLTASNQSHVYTLPQNGHHNTNNLPNNQHQDRNDIQLEPLNGQQDLDTLQQNRHQNPTRFQPNTELNRNQLSYNQENLHIFSGDQQSSNILPNFQQNPNTFPSQPNALPNTQLNLFPHPQQNFNQNPNIFTNSQQNTNTFGTSQQNPNTFANQHQNPNIFAHSQQNPNTFLNNQQRSTALSNSQHTQNTAPKGHQNPSIVIQTGQGNSNSMAPTVHVTLSTLPNTDQQNNSQPHALHVNLNTYPVAGQNHLQNGNMTPQISSSNLSNPAAPSNGNNDGAQALIQTGFSHPTTLVHTEQKNADTQTYWSNVGSNNKSSQRQSQAANPKTRIQNDPRWVKLPWESPLSTPAYPNRNTQSEELQEDSSDSSNSETLPQTKLPNPGRSGQDHKQNTTNSKRAAVSHAGRRMQQNLKKTESQNANTQTYSSIPQQQSAAHVPLQASSQVAPPNYNFHIHVSQPNAIPAEQLGSTPVTLQASNHPRDTSQKTSDNGAEKSGTQTRVTQVENPHSQATPQKRDKQSATSQHRLPALTQAALQKHTTLTGSPFQSRIDQTRNALSRPSAPKPGPLQSTTPGRHPPTPPPVLTLTQFHNLPREPGPQQPGPQHFTTQVPPHTPKHMPYPQRHHEHHNQPRTHRHHDRAYPSTHQQPITSKQAPRGPPRR